MATLSASALLLIALDQAVKALVLCGRRKGQGAGLGIVAIRPMVNRGGLGPFFSRPAILLTSWIAEAAVLLLLVHIGPLFQHGVAHVALGVALGGAGGNVIDRLCRGGVVDFVDVGFWPLFNVADGAIVMGALVAILSIR